MVSEHHAGTFVFKEYRLQPGTLAQINDYIVYGVPPGSFLGAVLSNNLREAMSAADENNMRNLPAFVAYLYNHAPATCWGSPEIVSDWLEEHRQRRESNHQPGER